MGRQNRFILVIALVLLTVGRVHAGGLWLYEEATPDMGVGGAGRQAAGMDASTASGNPAAMTRLDRSQIEGGFLGIYADTQFNVKNSSNGDNGGGNAGYFSPAGTMYLVHSVSPDLKFGLGVGTYFGLGLNYSNEWAGKILCPERKLHHGGRQPDHRLQNSRLAVGRLRSERGSGQAERAGGGQYANRTGRRPAQVRCVRRRVWLQPRGAFHPQSPNPCGGHLCFAGQSRFQ